VDHVGILDEQRYPEEEMNSLRNGTCVCMVIYALHEPHEGPKITNNR